MTHKEIELILSKMREKVFPRSKMEDVTALQRLTSNREPPFKILISTILSQRTRDQMTERATAQLFANYKTPKAIAEAPLAELEKLVKPANFYKTKALRVKEVSQMLVRDFKRLVPETFEELMSLPGVGRKTAACVMIYGFGNANCIPVDVHVWRISNRLGLVKSDDPVETEQLLLKRVPKEYWLEVNNLFVKYGQTICTPRNPKCGECPLQKECNYYKTIVKPGLKLDA